MVELNTLNCIFIKQPSGGEGGRGVGWHDGLTKDPKKSGEHL